MCCCGAVARGAWNSRGRVMALLHAQAQEQRREYFKGGTGLPGTRQGQKVTAKGVAFEAPLGDGSTVFFTSKREGSEGVMS